MFNIKSLFAAIFIGIFCASGSLLGLNFIEDREKEALVTKALSEATMVKADTNEIVMLSNGNNNSGMSVNTEYIPKLKDVMPSSEWGQVQGIISIPKRDLKCSISYGIIEYRMDSGACIHSNSYANSLVIMAHNYRNGTLFHNLLNTEVGDDVFIEYTDGTKKEYVIKKRDHINETDFKAKTPELFETEYNLVLVTCESQNMQDGRCVVYCMDKELL